MKKIINVKPDGTTQFVYDDKLRGLIDQGKAEIKRASHVEPGDPSKGQDPLKWYCDMSLSGGGILGPFEARHTALAMEVEWINQNVLTPTGGIDGSSARST